MSTHNIGFYEDLTKIVFELSSNIFKYAPSSADSEEPNQMAYHVVSGQGLYCLLIAYSIEQSGFKIFDLTYLSNFISLLSELWGEAEPIPSVLLPAIYFPTQL